MAKDTAERIEQRDRLSAQYLKDKSFLPRMMGEAGLAIANGMDRMTGWTENNGAVFMGGITHGLLRGAVYGALAGLLLAAAAPAGFVFSAGLFSVIAVAALARPKAGAGKVALGIAAAVSLAALPLLVGAAANVLFLSTVAAVSVGYGIHDGQKTLDSHLYGNPRTVGDWLAERLGAVPKTRNFANWLGDMTDTKWISRNFGIQPHETPKRNDSPLVREAPAAAKEMSETPESPGTTKSFTAREEARRAGNAQRAGAAL